MQEKFLIYLHANDLTHPSSFVINEEGLPSLITYREETDGLAQIAEGKEVIVMVPASDVTLLSVKLPKMNRSRLMKALPYALEEQLLGDINDLHLSLSDHAEGEDHPISVVSHEKMTEWLQLLQSWNIKPDIFLPEMLALPLAKNAWHGIVDEVAVVRTSKDHGFAADKNNLAELLSIAIHSAPQIPQTVYLQNTGEEIFFSNLNYPLQQIQRKPQEILTDLASEAVTSSYPINLLQGRYAQKKFAFPQMKKIWKWCAYLAIFNVFLLFIYPTVSYFIIKARIDSINNEISQIYKRHFPQAKNISSPQERMEEKLQKLIAEKNESQLLALITEIARGRMRANGIKLKRYDFINNQLTLEITAQSSEDFIAFTDFLMQQGLQVKQQNATLVGASVNAILEINS